MLEPWMPVLAKVRAILLMRIAPPMEGAVFTLVMEDGVFKLHIVYRLPLPQDYMIVNLSRDSSISPEDIIGVQDSAIQKP